MTVDEVLEELEELSARGLGGLQFLYADGSPYLTLIESLSVSRDQQGTLCVVVNEGAAAHEGMKVLSAFPPPKDPMAMNEENAGETVPEGADAACTARN